MPDFNDLIANLDKLEKELEAQLPKIVAVYAADALALANQRIEKEGAKPGAKYSEDPIYVSKSAFRNKSSFRPVGKFGKKANISAKFSDVATKKKKKKVIKSDGSDRTSMYLFDGYKELRQIQGSEVNVVNLVYTGRMRQNTQLLKTEVKEQFKVVAIIGGTNKETKDKLEGLYKKYGNFLGVTPEIAKVINVTPVKTIGDIVRRFLG